MDHILFLSIDRVLYPAISENGTLAVTPQKRENCVDRSIRNTHLPMRLLSCLIKLLYQISKIEIYAKQRNLVFMFGRCVLIINLYQEMVDLHSTKIGIFSQTKKLKGWDGVVRTCRLLLLWCLSRWLWIVFQPYGRRSELPQSRRLHEHFYDLPAPTVKLTDDFHTLSFRISF